ncbi:HTTM domain-containing protein [Streptomyces noursei]|uniref:HTTM domain-containing protein n=1 Tax=Streptomyces noursei TaxID=1971 RepID=UPI0019633835|nr:HTTM domain-containing protein [Streptomyces noursei]QRX91154.1 HTTM domain-containing protein [Streptomyces noursei]
MASTRSFSVLGVSGTRALLGFVGFMYYASQYGDRSYLFGPDGVLPWREFVSQLHDSGTFSLYAFSNSEAWFQIIFHLGMLTALAVACGVGGRLVLALHWVFLWSIYQRQTVLLDGGDNLAYVVIPMLLLTRCYGRLSFSTGVARKISRRTPSVVKALSDPIHNLGLLAIAVQICLVYMVSGLSKVQGKVWQDGTALFYVLRLSEFKLPGVSELIYQNEFLVFLGTYSTTIFLVYFPLGILVPRLRPWAAAASISFHLAIGIIMGLTSFALTMMACDLIFLSGALDALAKRCSRLIHRQRSAVAHERHPGMAPVSPSPSAAQSPPHPATVSSDG